jgi:hypothetical protein
METKENFFLVEIEFRFIDAPREPYSWTSKSKTNTIGVYETFEEACVAGNELLENLESKFPIVVFPSGNKAGKERFSENGGVFGGRKTLITNSAYLKTPFEFYARIVTLNYDSVDQTIADVLEATERYKTYKKNKD